MRSEFAERFLRCPACHRDRSLRLNATASNAQEVREGTLHCGGCGREFPVTRGVADLLHNPPEHVRREAAGLGRFAETMANDGWDRARILALPNDELGYWWVQRVMFEHLLDEVDFKPGESIIDIGSNTCWASGKFADLGLRAIALDISTAELQGLYTADYYFEAGRSHFERVVGTMNDIPIASGSLDYVFCCEVLHHNDPGGLRKTFAEAHRVLKPGGRMLVLNETLKYWRDRDGVHTEGVAQFEGYEHAHWAFQYRLGAFRAGFHRSRLLKPRYSPRMGYLTPRPDPARHPVACARNVLRHNPVTRQAMLAWLYHVAGGVQFSMIATKGPSQ